MTENTLKNIAEGKHVITKWKENKFAAIGHSVYFDVYCMEINQCFNRDKFMSELIEDKEFLN